MNFYAKRKEIYYSTINVKISKTRIIHFLHKKKPVPSQECDSRF